MARVVPETDTLNGAEESPQEPFLHPPAFLPCFSLPVLIGAIKKRGVAAATNFCRKRNDACMVDAYATTLGGFTLAVHHDRFIVEDSGSNSVLAPHPALLLASGRKPLPFTEVAGFSTGPDSMEVTWKPVSRVSARTRLSLCEGKHLCLSVSLENTGPDPVAVAGVAPVHVAADGVGACALGMHGLDVLASPDDSAAQPWRVDERVLKNACFGLAWAPGGSPAFLMGALESSGAFRDAIFSLWGARGKIVEVTLLCPLISGALAPGASLVTPEVLVAFGEMDASALLKEYVERAAQGGVMAGSPDLNTDAEAPTASTEIPDAPELVEPEPEEPVLPEPPEVLEAQAPGAMAQEDEEDSYSPSDRFRGISRTAAFRRALRANEDVYPRWAAGRRLPPLTGLAGRTRSHWQKNKQEM